MSKMKNNHESEEILACFKKEDLDQFHTGKIERIVFPKPRDIAHSEKIPHVISRIYAVNENGEYLVQKRSKNKNAHPGLYTDSASGHIRYHDNFNYEHIQREAARELEEEMGTSLLYHRLMDIRLEEFSNGGWELAYNILGVVKNQ